jgi:hypothetical protein
VEAAVVNEFESMKTDIGNIESTTSALSLPDYIEKWRILLWGKAFLTIMKGNPPFTKSTQLTKIPEADSIIKRVLYRFKL